MIAARERGLGTASTTIHLMFEEQAAEILGIDYESYTQCALITCGYTHGTDFKPAKRPPIETVYIGTGGKGKHHGRENNVRRNCRPVYGTYQR